MIRENRLDLHTIECLRYTYISVLQPAKSNTRVAPGVPCLTWALVWSQQPARRVGMIPSNHDMEPAVGSQIPMEDIHLGRPPLGLLMVLGLQQKTLSKALPDTPEKMSLPPPRGIFCVHMHGSTVSADGRSTSERLWTCEIVSVSNNCFF